MQHIERYWFIYFPSNSYLYTFLTRIIKTKDIKKQKQRNKQKTRLASIGQVQCATLRGTRVDNWEMIGTGSEQYWYVNGVGTCLPPSIFLCWWWSWRRWTSKTIKMTDRNENLRSLIGISKVLLTKTENIVRKKVQKEWRKKIFLMEIYSVNCVINNNN